MSAGSAEAYGGGSPGDRSAAETEQVWLRGNVRPVLAIGTLVVGGAAAAAGLAAVTGAGSGVVGPLGTAAAVAAVVAVALARVAAGPRLCRRGGALLVRLAPWRTDEVPLTVVECVFPGSQPLAGPVLRHDAHAGDAAAWPPPARRVGTLVIRFAERAVEWRERPTFAPWGTWHDGHAVLDGRWCEPLSAEVARAVSDRLLEAKREAAIAEGAR